MDMYDIYLLWPYNLWFYMFFFVSTAQHMRRPRSNRDVWDAGGLLDGGKGLNFRRHLRRGLS